MIVRFLLGLIISVAPILVLADEDNISDECKQFIDNIDGSNKSERAKAKMRSSSFLSRVIIWENDSFAKGGDRHYTNGIKVGWLHSPCRHRYEWLKPIFESESSEGLIVDDGELTYSTITTGGVFGMNMYTPNNISVSTRQREDRPYAGWLYGGLQLQKINSNFIIDNGTTPHYKDGINGKWVDRSSHVLELQIGLIGPQAGQEHVQKWVHQDITDTTIPQGWDNQVPNQIGVNALYTYRINRCVLKSLKWLSVPCHAGFSAGNVVNFVNAGAMISIGDMGNDVPGTTIQPTIFGQQNLPGVIEANESLNALGIEGDKDIPLRPVVSRTLFYVFAGIDYRYVFSSIFIEGSEEASHDIELVNNVYDLILGFAVKYKRVKFSYKIIERSKEFLSTDKSLEKSHRLGQFELEWAF